ncbi:MAG: AAA family ATPase, partial [Bacteroidota bacterium]
KEVVEKIDDWFEVFENSLKKIFEDEKLQLKFKHREYSFDIILRSGQTMPFNALSDGYSAILDIVMELMLRMEGKVKNVYDIQGIVLIDEIETHLHIDLQKKILPFLTSFFPKIQFIVSTHSPFVINSLSNAVVYDLENHTRFEDLSDYPIDGIVEGYFDNDKYSEIAKQKVEEYEKLTEKDLLTEAEKKRRLQLYNELKDVSGKLAPELKFKFQQIQLKRLAKTNG